jgi:hypothetical protein
MPDGNQQTDGACGYCGTDDLVYELHPGRGGVAYRCIECLAIEQGQQKVSLPFERWLDQDDIEPPEADSAPDIETFDPRWHDYMTVRAWFRVLARLKDDEPVLKRDADAPGAIFEDTREFLTGVMGEDAYKHPSELRTNDA